MPEKLYAIAEGVTLTLRDLGAGLEGALRGIGQGGGTFILPLDKDALGNLKSALDEWLDVNCE